MPALIENLLVEVSRRVTPNPAQRRRLLTLARRLKRQLETAMQGAKLQAEVRIEGSTAKDTWLSGAPEIDIFLQVPARVARAALRADYLEVAKSVLKTAHPTERYAEHPYLEAILGGIKINVVPCYRVKSGAWKSATDRTPFHTDYVKPLLNEQLRNNIRLLKQFMTGIGVYGAEIKTGGFSGYLCELLTIFYGSFRRVMEAASDWNAATRIDLAGHYRGEHPALERAFSEPLVVVDPVDKKRNVASAVRGDRLDEFIAAARALLTAPTIEFFFPPEPAPLPPEELRSQMGNRGSSLVLIVIGRLDAVPDVLWGQLYKSQRAIRRLARTHGFQVIRDAVWSDEQSLSLVLLEVAHRSLPRATKHWGPPLAKKAECLRFLRKHAASPRVVSGPRIERGRWVVETMRQYPDIVELLSNELKDGGRKLGVAGLVSQALAESGRIVADEAILSLSARNRGFAQFLSAYLRGKPTWFDAAYPGG